MRWRETDDEKDRAKIWDVLFREGGLDATDICKETGLGIKRVNRLVDHEWFVKLSGMVYIAKTDGRHIRPMLLGVVK